MIKAEFADRHGEHIDPELPLCWHGTRDLRIGDKYICDAILGADEKLCEIEIEVLGDNHIRVVVNHLDYLLAKKVEAAVQAKIASSAQAGNGFSER